MTAPIKKSNKKKTLPTCRVSHDDYDFIKERAAVSGLTFSEFQRRSLKYNQVIIKDGIATAELIKEINFIGKNLNQLVRKSHIHDEYDRERLHDILNTMDTVLMSLLNDS